MGLGHEGFHGSARRGHCHQLRGERGLEGVAVEETQFQAGQAPEHPVTAGFQPADELTVADQETTLLVGDDITLIHR